MYQSGQKKNLPLTPDTVTFGSNKTVWWKGSCGHEWQTSIKARSAGEQCPICSGARVLRGYNDFESKFPELAEGMVAKNEPLRPSMITAATHRKVIWRCKLGHEWTASVKSRTVNGTGCPYCSHNFVLPGFNDLASRFPEIAAGVVRAQPSADAGSGYGFQEYKSLVEMSLGSRMEHIDFNPCRRKSVSLL